jgi:hypothetical protein
VREVWILRAGKIAVHVLRGGVYEAVAQSEVLPAIDLPLLTSFLSVRLMTRAVRAFREALRG